MKGLTLPTWSRATIVKKGCDMPPEEGTKGKEETTESKSESEEGEEEKCSTYPRRKREELSELLNVAALDQ